MSEQCQCPPDAGELRRKRAALQAALAADIELPQPLALDIVAALVQLDQMIDGEAEEET